MKATLWLGFNNQDVTPTPTPREQLNLSFSMEISGELMNVDTAQSNSEIATQLLLAHGDELVSMVQAWVENALPQFVDTNNSYGLMADIPTGIVNFP